MSSNTESLARKQRATMRLPNGASLIDALRAGGRLSFATQSARFPRSYNQAVPPQWIDAFRIGWPDHRRGDTRIGTMFEMMYDNTLGVPDENEWTPARPMGNGSYGAVGLFKKVNEQGEEVDYVVAKYTESRDRYNMTGTNADISIEAAIMMQLNELKDDGLLFLRDFKFFEDTKRQLYLLEYCPSFDCEILRLAHKAMKGPIPEALIWYMFYAFAKALVTMEQGQFGHLETPHEHRSGAFLAHRDIKPPNSFLGYTPAPIQPLKDTDAGYLGAYFRYPYAKIADFGLSQITTLHSLNNQARNHQCGSRPWYPPEVRLDSFKKNTDWRPFRRTCFDQNGDQVSRSQVRDNGQQAYTPAANVFVVGFMMYQYMTLDEPDVMSFYINRCLSEDEQPCPTTFLNPNVNQAGNPHLDYFDSELAAGHGLPDNFMNMHRWLREIRSMLARWQGVEYDQRLKHLVEDCMKFLPERRILAVDLLQALELLMPVYWQTLQLLRTEDPTRFEKATRAFTTPADLAHMPHGNADVHHDSAFWRRLVRGFEWLDKEAGNIRPDMTGDNVPPEARAMFAPGRSEGKNQLAQGQSPPPAPAPAPTSVVAPKRTREPAPDDNPRQPKQRRILVPVTRVQNAGGKLGGDQPDPPTRS